MTSCRADPAVSSGCLLEQPCTPLSPQGGGVRPSEAASTSDADRPLKQQTLVPDGCNLQLSGSSFLPFVCACSIMSGIVPAHAVPLQVSVTGVRDSNGTVAVCVFDTDESFPDCSGDPAVTSRRQQAVSGTMRFDFDVAPGRHAVSVLHDENNNGRLDTNIFGIPREGVGVSNNPPPRSGPPRFADAVFGLAAAGGQVDVRLVYP